MSRFLKRFFREESGATSIEYALIATFIGLAIISSVRSVGTSLSPVFSNVAAKL